MQEMEATAADLLTWSEVKNSSPELHVVAAVKGTLQDNLGRENGGTGIAVSTRTHESLGKRNPVVKDCYECGRAHKYGLCPTFGQVCRKFGTMNHYEKLSKYQLMATQMVQSNAYEEE